MVSEVRLLCVTRVSTRQAGYTRHDVCCVFPALYIQHRTQRVHGLASSFLSHMTNNASLHNDKCLCLPGRSSGRP